jgi:hypothetical protein
MANDLLFERNRMRKQIKIVFALLLFLNSLNVCHASLGISYDNNIEEVTVTWTNNNFATAGLYGVAGVQSATNLASPINWAGVPSNSGAESVSLPAIDSQQFFRVALVMPLFQFGIFYNLNLETALAQTFYEAGPVFSNGGLWSGSATITFASSVSAVGVATNTTSDPFCAGYTGSGKSTYSISNQPTSGNSPLTPFSFDASLNPSSAEAFINLPPTNYPMGTSAAYTINGQLYLANDADFFLTNSPTGTNFGSLFPAGNNMALYYQDGFGFGSYLTWVTNDFYFFSNYLAGTSHVYATNFVRGFFLTNNLSGFKWTNNPTGTNQLLYASYSFLTNTLFYDAREGWYGGTGPAKAVQAVQIDVQKFSRWLTNSIPNGGSAYNNLSVKDKGHPIDSIYIYNAVPLTSTTLPAVRIVNGGMLPPYAFTLATAMPLYVWGDYNVSNSFGSSISQNSTVYTEPAGLMADAITVLSDNWSDASAANRFSGGPPAATTTINAACLAGIVESEPHNTASDADGYSGGVENYFRLLENWNEVSKQSLYFNGSIVAMFPSQYATNCWQQTAGYYTAPNRSWAFDINFFSPSGLPPLTPTVTGYITQ